MNKKKDIEATILDRNIITVPIEVRKMLDAKVGDSLVFSKEKNKIIVGRRRRTIIDEDTRFTVD